MIYQLMYQNISYIIQLHIKYGNDSSIKILIQHHNL